MIYVETPEWPGWEPYQLPGPDYARTEGVGACLRRPVLGGVLYISWGPIAQHAQAKKWRTLGSRDWYVDLEGFDMGLPGCCPDARTQAHLERRFRTREQAEGAALWLRSCVEVCGEEGLRALNERTGGRLA